MSLEFVNTQNHFFSDRTSLAVPSAFVRLGSFKRWPRYHTSSSRQPLFSKNFTIVCNPLPRNKIKTHFFLAFPFPPLQSTPSPTLSATKTTAGHTTPKKSKIRIDFIDCFVSFSLFFVNLISINPIEVRKRVKDKQDKRGQEKPLLKPFSSWHRTFFQALQFVHPSPRFPFGDAASSRVFQASSSPQDAASPKAQST